MMPQLYQTCLQKYLTHSQYVAIDRTQWRKNNLFMAGIISHKRALPIYWNLLEKKGCSNLAEQQALLRPVLKLLKGYKVVIIGDREFRGVALANWLSQQKVGFVFRQKKDTYVQLPNCDYQQLKSLEIKPGMKWYLPNVKLTKDKELSTGAIAYTITSLQGAKIKQTQKQKYVNRLQEKQRNAHRHSNFWVGLYGYAWLISWHFCSHLAQRWMELHLHKYPNYHRGLRAMTLIESTF